MEGDTRLYSRLSFSFITWWVVKFWTLPRQCRCIIGIQLKKNTLFSVQTNVSEYLIQNMHTILQNFCRLQNGKISEVLLECLQKSCKYSHIVLLQYPHSFQYRYFFAESVETAAVSIRVIYCSFSIRCCNGINTPSVKRQLQRQGPIGMHCDAPKSVPTQVSKPQSCR